MMEMYNKFNEFYVALVKDNTSVYIGVIILLTVLAVFVGYHVLDEEQSRKVSLLFALSLVIEVITETIRRNEGRQYVFCASLIGVMIGLVVCLPFLWIAEKKK